MKKARKLPKHTRDSWARSAKNNPEVVRQRYTALVGMKYYPTLIDYASRDMYELVKFYYRKRVDIYVDYLRANLDNPESFSMEELDKKYRNAAETFIKTPFEEYAAEPSPYLEHTIKAAQEVLDKISQTLRIH